MMVDVAIIGGGVSGLAAAVSLAQRGARVILLEQSPKLGGRCYSYRDETTDDIVDNGQHILVGAYVHTLKYLDLIGTKSFLHEESNLHLWFHHQEKGFQEFRLASLPHPLNFAAAVMKFSCISTGERFAMLKVGSALKQWGTQQELALSTLSVSQWLDSLGQSVQSKECFWYPLAVSIMNELPERASALLFSRALRVVLFGKKSDTSLLIPTVGQTELYVNAAEQFLQQRGSSALTNSEVTGIETGAGAVIGVRMKSGDMIKAGSVISSVPQYSLAKLLPMQYREDIPWNRIDLFPPVPIVSTHLWFDRDIMTLPYVGVLGGDVQWIFNRKMIMRESSAGGYISAVISGAYRYVDMTKDELVALTISDIRRVFPELAACTLKHSVVIKERRATFSPTNDVEALRPSAKTSIKNFYLAGDWTNTKLPATIEGAIKSGFTAADCVLSS